VAKRAWIPPSKLDERLKYQLVPPGLYIRYLVAKAYLKGEAELKLVPFLADPQRLSLDVGANKGVYSYVLRRHSRHVVAFEPNPKIRAVLSRWADMQVEVLPYALSEKSGRTELRIPRGLRGYSNQRGTLSLAHMHDDDGIVEVEARRLDELSFRDIGFIKIDVEGFERQVIEGARETLSRERPRLLIEIEEYHTRRPIEDDLAFVEGLGFRGYFLKNHSVLTPLSEFAPDAQHRGARERDRANYVFNFIFLPR
jgi:FkbM family methyltransferase